MLLVLTTLSCAEVIFDSSKVVQGAFTSGTALEARHHVLTHSGGGYFGADATLLESPTTEPVPAAITSIVDLLLLDDENAKSKGNSSIVPIINSLLLDPDLGPCVPALLGDNAAQLQSILDQSQDLVLCPGQVYKLSATLHYRVAGQQIYTLGNPEAEANQARLEWASEQGSEILVAGRQCCGPFLGIGLHHVTIDGMRRVYGLDQSDPPGDGMVAIIDAPGAIVEHNHLRDPRTWTALHTFIGCDGISITHNKIGPSKGGDGISYECQHGVVAHNEVVDAGDGAIVVFGGAGSRIHHNTIRSVNNVLLGGINMVDPGFNFQDTEVYENTIIAEGGRILVALAMGPNVWGFTCGGEEISPLEGAKVYSNHLEGDEFRFGYVLNGVKNWEFRDNTANGTFSGTSDGCNGNVPAPRAFACQIETVNDGECPPGTDVIEQPLNLDGVIFPTLMD
jgi:hypothetical protein